MAFAPCRRVPKTGNLSISPSLRWHLSHIGRQERRMKMITLRTAAVAAAILASAPAFAQGQNYPRPNESQAGWTGNNYGNLYSAGPPPNGGYAAPAATYEGSAPLGGGTVPGVVGGAAVGAAVGGP